MTTAILFGSFLLLLLIGVPIGIALGAASMLAILYIPFLSLDMYALGLVSASTASRSSRWCCSPWPAA